MIILYNKLPLFMKKESDHGRFKRMLKALLLKKPYYTIEDFLVDNLNL